MAAAAAAVGYVRFGRHDRPVAVSVAGSQSPVQWTCAVGLLLSRRPATESIAALRRRAFRLDANTDCRPRPSVRRSVGTKLTAPTGADADDELLFSQLRRSQFINSAMQSATTTATTQPRSSRWSRFAFDALLTLSAQCSAQYHGNYSYVHAQWLMTDTTDFPGDTIL